MIHCDCPSQPNVAPGSAGGDLKGALVGVSGCTRFRKGNNILRGPRSSDRGGVVRR